MAKAAKETTTWILLRDARALAVEAYQSAPYAERQLVEKLLAGELRWRCLHLVGRNTELDPKIGDAEFWRSERRNPHGRMVQIIKLLNINWAESSAYRRISPLHGYTAIRIEVPREDVLKVLPQTATVVVPPAVRWIAATFQQMKLAGDIPAGTSQSKIAKQIRDRMQAAARSGEISKVLSVNYIRNTLRGLETDDAA